MTQMKLPAGIAGAILMAAGVATAAPREVAFSQSAPAVQAYDFVEVGIQVVSPDVRNPFTEASVTGWFAKTGSNERLKADGFCDSADGTAFRIRFTPASPGDYSYAVTYRQDNFEKSYSGTFRATDGHRRGPIRVDPRYPWHFIWEGTGEHYFFNGTTAYWLLGWRDERVIRFSIDRLHRLKIDRMRVTIAGRTSLFYGDAVMNGGAFTVFLVPWPAEKAEDIYHPGFDYTRFNISYWQKFDRALRYARERDMIISLVLDMGDGKVHPAAGSEDEHQFIRYAVARFSAFSNITWDLGDDLDVYRDEAWSHATGTLIKQWDAYKHLATSHPTDNAHQDRMSEWFDFTSFQEWSRKQHEYMLNQRRQQEKLGRIIPQTNEEYGYEDHYPLWAPEPGADSADALRRTAWDIVMAGGYGTTGESARRGTNIWPDTGGGWFNGRGDDTMTMLDGYAHMVDFFTSFEWWKTEPHDELVNNGAYCVAERGRTYAIYLPHGGDVTVKLEPGTYRAEWFGALTGEKTPIGAIDGPTWTSPKTPDSNDWALLLRKQ
jgi:hypothetical protein